MQLPTSVPYFFALMGRQYYKLLGRYQEMKVVNDKKNENKLVMAYYAV